MTAASFGGRPSFAAVDPRKLLSVGTIKSFVLRARRGSLGLPQVIYLNDVIVNVHHLLTSPSGWHRNCIHK
jgi:hypothetical protein